MTVGYFDQQLAELDDEMDGGRCHPAEAQADEPSSSGAICWPASGLPATRRCRRSAASAAASGAARPWPGWPPPDANFLVLDEPTNHLDLWARDALETALTHFDGTVLFVSHDRYFVNRVADHLLMIEPDRVRDRSKGITTAYQMLLEAEQSTAASAVPPTKLRKRQVQPEATRSTGEVRQADQAVGHKTPLSLPQSDRPGG